MKILAIDTANYACSATVWRDGSALSNYSQYMIRGQSEALLPAIEFVMKQAVIRFNELDAIAVTTGPGSFTGVRVGLATARAIGLANAIPTIGILSTQVIATQIHNDTNSPIAVVLDARRMEIYIQLFSPGGEPIDQPHCVTPKAGVDMLNDGVWLVCGNATELIKPHLNQRQSIIYVENTDTAVLAELATHAPKTNNTPSPVYVRPPDAKIPENEGRIRV